MNPSREKSKAPIAKDIPVNRIVGSASLTILNNVVVISLLMKITPIL